MLVIFAIRLLHTHYDCKYPYGQSLHDCPSSDPNVTRLLLTATVFGAQTFGREPFAVNITKDEKWNDWIRVEFELDILEGDDTIAIQVMNYFGDYQMDHIYLNNSAEYQKCHQLEVTFGGLNTIYHIFIL